MSSEYRTDEHIVEKIIKHDDEISTEKKYIDEFDDIRTLFDSSIDIMMIADHSGKILYLNNRTFDVSNNQITTNKICDNNSCLTKNEFLNLENEIFLTNNYKKDDQIYISYGKQSNDRLLQ